MSLTIIYLAVFLGVAALVGALAFISSGDREAEVEERLSALTASKTAGKDGKQYKELLSSMRSDTAGGIEKFVSRYLNLRQLFEQANVSLSVPKFGATCAVLAVVGLALPMVAGFNMMLAPVMAATLGF